MVRSADPATRKAGGRRGVPRRATGLVLVALLALTGTALIRTGLEPAPVQPPQPADVAPAAGTAPTATPRPPGSTRAGPRARATSPAIPPLPRSAPKKISIPRIKVDARILPLGLNSDGTVQVPPLKQAQHAGWYKLGPSPGEIGNAVIVGHVDSAALGPAVFFKLGALKPGDRIEVTRADGKLARFVVETVRSYPKTAFPAELVYGNAETARLQVVTCGGTFDRKKRSYPNNIVVSASRIP